MVVYSAGAGGLIGSRHQRGGGGELKQGFSVRDHKRAPQEDPAQSTKVTAASVV